MDTKGSQSPSTTNLSNVLSEDGVVYIAVKGSLYANDSSVFGLGQEEIKALTSKFPGSGVGVVNGVTIKTNVLNSLNALGQLGYKIISSTGETEITWTLQRDI
ncbi:PREDICTED: uncharacterized protein LOC106099489 [Papilio polytes]|uniref:Uncharacterized protein n=1 Tax=Papilio xuthus TaxID=66420 RepID=A0A194PK42_PAPXU|nr:PREDICTED: uncharacterized protein LOC106099489 [Papilio polytes]KPI93806.1 hypothetical protein RR46_12971 [Papilio xuthus]